MDDIELFDIPTSPSPIKKAAENNIQILANKLFKLQKEKEELETKLKAKNAEIMRVESVELIEAMSQARATYQITENGYEVEVSSEMYGSLPKDLNKRKKALSTLRGYGAQSLISSTIEIVFKKGDNKKSMVAEELNKMGILFSDIEDVNHNSLKKLARERIKNGEVVDFDALGLFMKKVATVKRKE